MLEYEIYIEEENDILQKISTDHSIFPNFRFKYNLHLASSKVSTGTQAFLFFNPEIKSTISENENDW